MIKSFLLRSKYAAENSATLKVADCRKFLRTLPDGCAQLVVTSPPYNIRKSYELTRISIDSYLNIQREAIEHAVRVLAPGGSLCWQVGNHITSSGAVIPLDLALYPIFSEFEERHSLRLRNRIVWHFEHGLNCQNRFSGRSEVILWYTKGAQYTFNLDDVRVPQKYPGKRAYKGPRKGQYSGNPLGKNPGDVWCFPNVKANHPEKAEHPCQFPVELAERLVLALSNEGDLVIDPFAGVGSALVAAVLHKRRAAGCDIDAGYVTIARSRIKRAAEGTLRYRPYNKPLYSPRPNTSLTTTPWHQLTTTKTA